MDSPQFTGAANNKGLTFKNADGTTLKTLITAGTNGTKVVSIPVVNEQAGTQVGELHWNDGSTDFRISTTDILGLAGSAGAAVGELLDDAINPGIEIDNNGNTSLKLGAGQKLKVKMQVTIAGGETVYVTAFGADF